MDHERYLGYLPPSAPIVEWTDDQLFDEVDWLGTHLTELNPTGERKIQLSRRLATATMEQMIRYQERHGTPDK